MNIEEKYKEGQKLICIKDTNWNNIPNAKTGIIYTIADLGSIFYEVKIVDDQGNWVYITRLENIEPNFEILSERRKRIIEEIS